MPHPAAGSVRGSLNQILSIILLLLIVDRYDDAQNLLSKYSYAPANEKDLRVVLTDDHPFDINQYLLPFAIVVGICFVIMLVIVVYKCIQVFMENFNLS